MRPWKGAVQGADEQFLAKRQAILREAASSFNRKGYHGTSLVDIANTLGVSKAALYTYVKSKDELLLFCHEAAMDAAQESLHLARQAGGTALDQFCATLSNYLGMIMSNQACYVVLLEEQALPVWEPTGEPRVDAALDLLAGLDPDDSFEALYRYYQGKVGVVTDSSSGITTLTVRAFGARPAVEANRILLEQSEALVNRLNERGRMRPAFTNDEPCPATPGPPPARVGP